MSGRKIDDQKFWAGGKSKASVFPEGVHSKSYSSAEGAGHLGTYEDTSEAIHKQQERGKQKIHGHASKEGYRN